MAAVTIGLNDAESRGSASLSLDMLPPEQTSLPRMTQPFAGFTVDPYAIANGFPVEDAYGLSSVSSCRVGAITTGAGFPSPSSAVLGSDNRWISTAATVSATTWSPVTGTTTISFFNKVSGVIDPVHVPGYSYLHEDIRVLRPAVAFKGGGYAQINAAASAQNQCTLAYVFVPHPGKGPFWSFFDTGVYVAGSQLNMRYRKGAIQVYTGAPTSGRLINYECHLVPGEPVIVLISFDVTNSVIRFAVYDRHRTTRVVTIVNLAGLYLNGLIGMSVGTGGAADYSKAPAFEMLELDIWNRALSLAEFEETVATLSAVYAAGV